MIGRLRGRVAFMHDHFWTGTHVEAYLDGEVGAAGAARIERHTHVCPKCHRMLETLKRTLEGLRGLSGASPAPAGLADSVVERLRDGAMGSEEPG